MVREPSAALNPDRKIVAVIGKGKDCPAHINTLAFNAGLECAHRGDIVVTGGLGGVMHYALHGARIIGGTAIALVPDVDESEINCPPGTIILRTGLSHMTRNVVIGSCADRYLVCPGSHGTMQELLFALDRGAPIELLGDHTGWPTEVLAGLFSAVR